MRRYNLAITERDEENLEAIREAADCTTVRAVRLALHLTAKLARKEIRIFSSELEREVWILDLE